MDINSLEDLNSFRSAPQLRKSQIKKLLTELEQNIKKADWITVGIMAPTENEAVKVLQTISKKYSSINFKDLDCRHIDGSVFLKGNQKTGNVYISPENGLGEGILLTCQYDQYSEESTTFGPLPLEFFT